MINIKDMELEIISQYIKSKDGTYYDKSCEVIITNKEQIKQLNQLFERNA